jgi:hypothetical protein
MRSLSDDFLGDLKNENGILKNLLDRIKKDSTLDLQFRSNYIDIYYRGGKVLNLTKNTRGYTAKIDKNYFQNEQVSFIENIQSANDMQTWISQLPLIKQARDFHYTENKNTAEREFQQLIIRSNNYERTSNSSDFFITDMEYDFKIETADKKKGKIDLIGIEWHSSNRGKNSIKAKFAFIEVKFGNSAVSGKSGLHDHLNDITEYLVKHQEVYQDLRKDTLKVFQQKRELGLYNFGKDGNENQITEIDTKPYFIILLADYKNKQNNLYNLIEQINLEKYENHFDLRFSISSFMGYGLYSDCLLTKDEILKHLVLMNEKSL